MRYSLSPEPPEWERGRFRLREEDSSSESDSEEDSVMIPQKDSTDTDNDDYQYSDSDDDEEQDYPHPIGFPAPAHSSWGRTRFCLDPSVTPDSIDEQWSSNNNNSNNSKYTPSYPPLSSYMDPQTAPTSSLLRYHDQEERKHRMQQENDREMDQITQLLNAASLVDTVKLLGPSQTSQSDNSLIVLADTANRIQQKINLEKQRMEKEHREAAEALKMLLKKTRAKADKLIQDEKDQEAADQAQREKEEAKEEQRRQEEAKADKIEQKQLEIAKKKKAEMQAAEAAKTEYITKAEKLVAQLRELRKSIEPFDKSKALSKRRLNMKKVANGKVNTLAENSDRIRSVAAEVGQAITAARAEDADLKKQQEAGNSQITPEMTRGKRYFLDLLASSVMKRAQAEGFNG